jgi:hypothetical protein
MDKNVWGCHNSQHRPFSWARPILKHFISHPSILSSTWDVELATTPLYGSWIQAPPPNQSRIRISVLRSNLFVLLPAQSTYIYGGLKGFSCFGQRGMDANESKRQVCREFLLGGRWHDGFRVLCIGGNKHGNTHGPKRWRPDLHNTLSSWWLCLLLDDDVICSLCSWRSVRLPLSVTWLLGVDINSETICQVIYWASSDN